MLIVKVTMARFYFIVSKVVEVRFDHKRKYSNINARSLKDTAQNDSKK